MTENTENPTPESEEPSTDVEAEHVEAELDEHHDEAEHEDEVPGGFQSSALHVCRALFPCRDREFQVHAASPNRNK